MEREQFLGRVHFGAADIQGAPMKSASVGGVHYDYMPGYKPTSVDDPTPVKQTHLETVKEVATRQDRPAVEVFVENIPTLVQNDPVSVSFAAMGSILLGYIAKAAGAKAVFAAGLGVVSLPIGLFIAAALSKKAA